MKCAIPVFIVVACITLCNAQIYNISGVVKNSAGSGIEGVTVRLGQAGILTTTGAGGGFTLDGTSTVFRTGDKVSGMQHPEVLRDGRLSFVTIHKGEVHVMVYDCNGRLRLSHREIASSGKNMLSLPRLAVGMYIYRVTFEDRQYTFKSVAGTAAKSGQVSERTQIPAARMAKTAVPFDDALLAVKDGYQLYRLEIKNPDTMGIQVTLLPLITGTVTDIDGFAYRTVQIGSQVWTAENIRTTKYNDGTPLSDGTDEAVWSNNTTGAYCFYNKSTDAAYQQKWGAMYNWYAVGSGKLAPAGWRVPTRADWDTLVSYLLWNGYSADGRLWENTINKSMATKTDWLADTSAGVIGNDLTLNNSTGFSALPGGSRNSMGTYDGQFLYGYWWLSSAFDSSISWFRRIDYGDNLGMNYATPNSCGFSVRLVRVN